MPFEWLPQDEAAEALGVDLPTLTAWIDDGRAPSRKQGGQVQVLIEFDDASEEGDAADAASGGGGGVGESSASNNGHGKATGSAGGARRFDPDGEVELETSVTDVVLSRELQMAAGCVAAWQRLAEHADVERQRTRRVNIAGWATVAVLAIAGGIGIGVATKQVSDSDAAANLTGTQLGQTQQTAADRAERITQLEADNRQLMQELKTTRSQLAEATKQAALTQEQVEHLTAQVNRQEQTHTERKGEQSTLVATLRGTIQEQSLRITGLERDLDASATELKTARTQLNQANDALLASGRDLAQARQDLLDAKSKLADVSLELRAAQQSLGSVTEARDTLREQLNAESQRHTKTKETLATLESRVKTLEQDLKAQQEAARKRDETPADDDSKPGTGKPETTTAADARLNE